MHSALRSQVEMPLSRLILRHGLWAPLLALVATLIFGAIGGRMLWQERQLDLVGVDTTGQVVAREIVRRTTRDNRDTVDDPTLTIRYSDAQGRSFSRRMVVSPPFYEAHTIGTELTLRYLPSDPTVMRLMRGPMSSTAVIFVGLAGVMAVGFVLALVRWGPEAASARRAAAGPPSRARVERVVWVSVADGARPKGRILWDGGASRPRLRSDLPAPGTLIEVRTDPRRGRQWWEVDL
jgi:hypothetical protein